MLPSLQQFVMGFRDGYVAGLRESEGTLDLVAEPSRFTDLHYFEGAKAGFLLGYESAESTHTSVGQ